MDQSQPHCAEDCPTRRLILIPLVVLQFVLSSAIVVTHAVPTRPIQLMLLIVGVSIGVWAIRSMSPGTLSVVPSPRDSGQLCSRGPYRLVRHPMYTGLLLAGLSFIVCSSSAQSWLLWACLFVVLFSKAYYEELMLVAKYEEYTAYRRGTGMLLPRIF